MILMDEVDVIMNFLREKGYDTHEYGWINTDDGMHVRLYAIADYPGERADMEDWVIFGVDGDGSAHIVDKRLRITHNQVYGRPFFECCMGDPDFLGKMVEVLDGIFRIPK